MILWLIYRSVIHFEYIFITIRHRSKVNIFFFFFAYRCSIFFGEGNGNPLQCSCLENPRDGGSWWAAVYGVAQSRTRLKRLSSSSSSSIFLAEFVEKKMSFLHWIVFTPLSKISCLFLGKSVSKTVCSAILVDFSIFLSLMYCFYFYNFIIILEVRYY